MIEDIIRYLDKEMSAEESSRFEELLRVDTDLMEQYKSVLAAKKLSSHWIDTEIKGYIEVFKKKEKKDLPKKKTFSFWWSIILTVLVLIIVATFFWYLQNEKKPTDKHPDSLYAMQYEPPIWPNVRGEETIISQAVTLHLEGKTDAALQLLDKKIETTEDVRYWAAEILIHAGRCENAKKYLDQLTVYKGDTERINFLKKYCKNK